MKTVNPETVVGLDMGDFRHLEGNLKSFKIINGVYWVAVPAAGLYILCGCPADSVKHMRKQGLIVAVERDGVTFNNGPNAILLSDDLIQNRQFSNLSEFPVLQMLYSQGLIVPGHPNNTGVRPLLIGSEDQVEAQKEYIYRGNYGLVSEDELIDAGFSPEVARKQMRLKRKFAFGDIKKTEELIDTFVVGEKKAEIRNGLYIQRLRQNVFEFEYGDETVTVDLNLGEDDHYAPPYDLGYHRIKREYFAVVHSGEGDGWDIYRPCMGSVLMYQGRIYLIDAGPNISTTLMSLGIDPSEVEGIFHTHAHDDHFAGLPTFLEMERKVKYYATRAVRASVTKKLCALMSISEEDFADFFEIVDLEYDKWNDIGTLEVKPIVSPHPVETSILKFRALWEDGYHTYAHWADIAGLDILREMITDDEDGDGISQEDFDQIAASYLEPADLKKIDIGGGMIHGNALDFREDTSGKICLAHKASPLTKQEKVIGSNATFGATDVLIESNRDYTKIKAHQYLRDLFPDASEEEREMILNSPVVEFNPGSVLFKNDEDNDRAYLLLTGTVEYVDSESGVQKRLRTGSLVGDLDVLEDYHYSGTFRADSYIKTLQFAEDLCSRLNKKG